jgi:formamidopyrimidine-DNA glycosylase
MPELPEVETVVQGLREADIIGREIVDIAIYYPKLLEGSSQELLGQKICSIERIGKWIIIHLDIGALLVHLRMTGKFDLGDTKAELLKYERARLILEGGITLSFSDQRKFARWYLVDDPMKKLSTLGIDPTTPAFTIKAFEKRISSSGRKIKPLLLDQTYVAGLGNIYVDEVLWHAGVHPERQGSSLSSQERKKIFDAVKLIISEAIKHKGTSLGSHSGNFSGLHGDRGENFCYLKVYRREGKECLRCGEEIVKMKVGGRGTHYCPGCQS